MQIKKRFELYFCCFQISLVSNKVVESNTFSYFLIIDIEIIFQILGLSKRKTDVFVQKIILVEQIFCFADFALYQNNKFLFFDKLYYLH